MTAHQFAKQLLEGPDLPIFVPAVIEYDDSDESARTPLVTKIRGESTDTDELCDLLMISYEANVRCGGAAAKDSENKEEADRRLPPTPCSPL
jgi:hypothetical protein